MSFICTAVLFSTLALIFRFPSPGSSPTPARVVFIIATVQTYSELPDKRPEINRLRLPTEIFLTSFPRDLFTFPKAEQPCELSLTLCPSPSPPPSPSIACNPFSGVTAKNQERPYFRLAPRDEFSSLKGPYIYYCFLHLICSALTPPLGALVVFGLDPSVS